jgi:hypothetical protein
MPPGKDYFKWGRVPSRPGSTEIQGIIHLGALSIENALTLIVIDFCSVATGLTLVAIGSRRAAVGWSIRKSFVSSCNGLDLL